MQKVMSLTTQALGGEPGIPDLATLAGWVADHRGIAVDLRAYWLDVLLAQELSAGITVPCAGGLFYHERVRESLIGLNANRDTVIGEIHVDTSTLIEDAILLATQKKDVWCALPAPQSLGFTDDYYGDSGEWSDAITAAYRTIMREMRDAGIGGHVLICDTVDEQEISILAGKKVFFFAPAPKKKDFMPLMEYQRRIAVSTKNLEMAIDLSEMYNIHQWIIMEPNNGGIGLALSQFDPDQIIAGGYCKEDCDNYWKKLVESAVYMK